MDIVLENIIIGKADTTANWTSDATVYSLGFMMISSDATYSGTNVKKWKIANGVDIWSDIDFVPVAETLAQILTNGNSVNGQAITSQNGFGSLMLDNAYINCTFGTHYNGWYFDNAEGTIYWSNGSNVGQYNANASRVKILHSDEIELDADLIRLTVGHLEGRLTKSKLALLDTLSVLSFEDSTFTNGFIADIQKAMSYYYNSATGTLAYTEHKESKTTVSHQTNIELTSASVTKNGSEIVTTNDTRIVKSSFDVSFDGQGGVITVNANAIKRAVANGGTVTGFSLKGDVSGSIEIDMKKNGVSMVGAGNKIDLVSQSSDTGSPTSWTSTTFVADDEIEFVVSSATTITKLWLTIKYDKTS